LDLTMITGKVITIHADYRW